MIFMYDVRCSKMYDFHATYSFMFIDKDVRRCTKRGRRRCTAKKKINTVYVMYKKITIFIRPQDDRPTIFTITTMEKIDDRRCSPALLLPSSFLPSPSSHARHVLYLPIVTARRRHRRCTSTDGLPNVYPCTAMYRRACTAKEQRVYARMYNVYRPAHVQRSVRPMYKNKIARETRCTPVRPKRSEGRKKRQKIFLPSRSVHACRPPTPDDEHDAQLAAGCRPARRPSRPVSVRAGGAPAPASPPGGGAKMYVDRKDDDKDVQKMYPSTITKSVQRWIDGEV